MTESFHVSRDVKVVVVLKPTVNVCMKGVIVELLTFSWSLTYIQGPVAYIQGPETCQDAAHVLWPLVGERGGVDSDKQRVIIQSWLTDPDRF